MLNREKTPILRGLLSPALIVRRAFVGLSVVLTIAASAAFGPQGSPPQDLGPVPGYTPVVGPDGTIEHYFTRGGPIYPDTRTPYGTSSIAAFRPARIRSPWSPPLIKYRSLREPQLKVRPAKSLQAPDG